MSKSPPFFLRPFLGPTRFDSKQITWGPLLAISISLLALLLAAAAYSLFSEAYRDLAQQNPPLPAALLAGGAVLTAVTLSFVSWREGSLPRALEKLGLRESPGKSGVALALLLFVLVSVVQSLGSVFIQVDQAVSGRIEQSLSLPMFLAVCLLVPFYEELLVRGLLFSGLRTRLPFLPAAAISGLFFGLLHAEGSLENILALLAIMTLSSLALSWAYEKTGSLWSAIILHSAMNSTAFLAMALS